MTSISEQLTQLSKSLSADHAYALAAPAYVAPEIIKIEHQSIFKNSWQYGCHQSQVSKPGDVHVFEIDSIPLVIVHGTDGEIRAFYNVCKHRAGPVACESTNVKKLRCAYHGWTYDLTGQLKVAPEMDTTPGFDTCQVQLTQVQCTVWQSMIFVHLGKNPEPIESIFEGITNHIKPIQLSEMVFHHRETYEIGCQWKVYMDNYLEGYHLPYVHPGLSKLLDYREYETELFNWYSLQTSPIQGSGNFYGPGTAYYYCVYPNLMLNILPGRCQLNQVLPISTDRCLVHFDYFYSQPESKQAQRLIEQDLEFSDEIQQEDIDICVQVQKGLSSGSYQAGRLCHKREQGVWHFQELVRSAYRQWLLDNNG